MPAATDSSSELIASVTGGPLDAYEPDNLHVILVVDDDLPPLVMLSVWDGTHGLTATAAFPLPVAARARDALDQAIARGEAVDRTRKADHQ
jgi:hypothetical protein